MRALNDFWGRFAKGARQAPASFVVLSAGLLLTLLAWRYAARRIEADNRAYFEREVSKAKEEIGERVRDYVEVLYGVRGLFALHEEAPSAAEWKRYTDSLDLIRRYPGIHDISFARYVRKADKADFERRARRGGLGRKDAPSFSIHPPGERGAYYPIEYVEPSRWSSDLFGFDIGGDPVRLAAIERARDTGEPVGAGPILLVSPPKIGFAIRLPVYRRGASLGSVEERRRALLGFVTSAYEIDKMMGEVFGPGPRDFDFEIYTGAISSAPGAFPSGPKRLLYDDDKVPRALDSGFRSRYSRWESLQVAGRTWSVYFSARPDFRAGLQEVFPYLILAGGLVITLSLFGGAWFLGTSRRRALDLARAMTADVGESEERFRAIFDQATVGMAITGLDGRWLRVNQKLCDLVGYTVEELMERGFQGITHPEDLRADLAYFPKVVAGETYATEKRYLRKGGGVVWVSLNVFPVRAPSGRPKYVIAMMNDITERRRAEEEIRFLQTITLAVSVAEDLDSAFAVALRKICETTGWVMGQVWLPSPEGTRLRPGPAWRDDADRLRQFGAVNAEMTLDSISGPLGKAWSSRRPAWICDVAADLQCARAAAVREAGIKAGMAIPVLAGDEAVAVIEFFTLEPRQEDGRMINLVSMAAAQLGSVIRRKRAEEEVRRSEERYRTLVEQASDGIFIADPEWNLIDVNARGCAMLGFSREELLRMRIVDLIPSEDLQTNPIRMDKVLAGETFVNERRLKRKEGAPLPVEISSKMLPDGRLQAIARDVTERRRMEAALAESERKYRNLVETSNDVHWAVDAEGRVTFVNQASKRIYGYEPEEMIGRRFTEFQTPERAEQDIKQLDRLQWDRFSSQYETQMIRKDGSTVWLSANSIALYDDQGRFLGAMGTSRDTTEERRAAEALREREFLFRHVVDSNMIGIVFGGQDGSVSEANEAFLKTVGYTREDLLSGKVRLDRMTPPEHYRLDEKAAQEAVRLGVCSPYEKELIRKDGTRVPVLVGAAKLPGRPGKGVGFILDISERRRAEEALAERENLLRMIFDAEPECVQLVSVNGSLLNINRAGLKMIEADHLTQVVGKSIYPLVDPRHRQAFKALMGRVLQGESGELEFRVIGLKGTRRWMETYAVPFRNRKGEIIAFLGVTRDVTVRRKTEEELKISREQLRNLSARLQWMLEEERTRIAREIHDELGQLLTALKMELSWVGNRLSDDSAPLGQKIQSMSQLIDTTIQTVRKIATELRPGVLDDLGLTAAIEWQAREFQRRTGIRCDCDLPDDLTMDPARSTAIFRILQEALTNVARHAEASKIKIHLGRRNGLMVMKISDDGKGIEESQLSNPKSLGLLGMRERALLWGGEVEIRGTKSKGTMVTVRIPAHRREGEAP